MPEGNLPGPGEHDRQGTAKRDRGGKVLVAVQTPLIIDAGHFPALLDALARRGYRLVGPAVEDGVIGYTELTGADALPVGWTDEQDAGFYRLKKRADGSFFGYNTGPHTWKRFLYPAVVRLWQARRSGRGWEVVGEGDAGRYTLIGVRPCDLHALAVLDRVFLQGVQAEPVYASRRGFAFILAVNCTRAGGTCFCASTGTGPRVTHGFDLALTEVLADDRHYFVAEIGSHAGAAVINEVAHRAASDEETAEAARLVAAAAREMGRTLDTAGLREFLYANYEHPHWERVAARCLSCGNCTVVCPTCFCTTVEDLTSLGGEVAERWRRWDSCFTLDFSYIHGGSLRISGRARYRQWLVHKLATLRDQFGVPGCVGCGRCITWCPVGIDLTQEVAALRAACRAV